MGRLVENVSTVRHVSACVLLTFNSLQRLRRLQSLVLGILSIALFINLHAVPRRAARTRDAHRPELAAHPAAAHGHVAAPLGSLGRLLLAERRLAIVSSAESQRDAGALRVAKHGHGTVPYGGHHRASRIRRLGHMRGRAMRLRRPCRLRRTCELRRERRLRRVLVGPVVVLQHLTEVVFLLVLLARLPRPIAAPVTADAAHVLLKLEGIAAFFEIEL